MAPHFKDRDLVVIRARARAGHALRESLLHTVPADPRLREYLAWVSANDTALTDDVLWLCDELERYAAAAAPKEAK